MSERLASVDRLLRMHRRLALDSNALIYLLEATDDRAEAVAQIVDACDEGLVDAVASTVALAEILTGPSRAGDAVAFEHLAAALHELPISWVAPGAEIAVDAAWYRGRARSSLADALHVATARSAEATAFITNDRDIVGTTRLEVVYLDDLASG